MLGQWLPVKVNKFVSMYNSTPPFHRTLCHWFIYLEMMILWCSFWPLLAPFNSWSPLKISQYQHFWKWRSFRVLHFCVWCKFLWCDPVSRFLAKGPLALSRRSTLWDNTLLEAHRMLSIVLCSWMISELPALCLDLWGAAWSFMMVPFCEEMNRLSTTSTVWCLCRCPYCCPYRTIGWDPTFFSFHLELEERPMWWSFMWYKPRPQSGASYCILLQTNWIIRKLGGKLLICENEPSEI